MYATLGMAAFAGFLKRWLTHVVQTMSRRRLLILAAVAVAFVSGSAALVLKAAVHFLQVLARERLTDGLYMFAPAVGILLAVGASWFLFRDQLRRGTAYLIYSISRQFSRLPLVDRYGHVITSALTVGMGGSVGIESPIVQTGAAIGSWFGSNAPFSYQDRTLLLACGVASGIAAAFNAPIAGVLFAIEVLLIDFSVQNFLALILAGATGALCSQIFDSSDILLFFSLQEQFRYTNTPFYVVLAFGCGAYSAAYIKFQHWFDLQAQKFANKRLIRWALGVSSLAILLVFLPALFGEGYVVIDHLANQSLLQALSAYGSIPSMLVNNHGLLLVLVVTVLLKPLAVSLTLFAGGNGGNFAPALFIGACLGFLFASVANEFLFLELPLSNFTLVGMAGILSGIFHAPLTAIFLIAEITGGYGLIIPLMVVSVISLGVSRHFQPLSLDEIKLKQMDDRFHFSHDTRVLSGMTLANLLETDFATIAEGATMADLRKAITQSKRNIFPVVDKAGKLTGVITLDDVRKVMFDDSLSATGDELAHFVQTVDVAIDITDGMASVMEKFEASGLWNIPVVAAGRYVGFVSKSKLLSGYRETLKHRD